ncbi:ABC transporter ATP-binding protein [Desulfobulbus rhabdoformis]|uniref:ABC transporter ATP-binding protein n=1 Tax=Desulfobulbus rhabdoformis TaxID=34032 RepID=UPI001962D8DA|nr:ABC transporter ATP-binding protein [Desulfobulbus rhabdoformis]MBM9612935.1 ABC transporter ATP-binding protein [Desulfobulbus rhabdoformis]
MKLPQEYNENAAITAEVLCRQYKGQPEPALDHFSLSIAKGEFYGLLGPNGAGKTTIMSILAGLQVPDSGNVRIHGMGYGRHGQVIKARIGLVPQDLALYQRLTGMENMWYFARLLGLSGQEAQVRIAESLEFCQLQDRARQPVLTYSGGMKRRLNLAIGLLNDPWVLFLDEPTVGVDTQSRHLIHQQLRQLHQRGTTILYTTHYMEEAQELCSRIAILDHGKILEEGAPKGLLSGSDHRNLEELFICLTGQQLRDD